MKLTDAKPDQHGLVRRIGGDAHFANRITAIGLTEGTELQMVRNDRKMPVLVYLRETLIAINRKDAGRIEVETV
jgi:ferrous iron transport protein A